MDLLGVLNQVVQNNTEGQKLTDLAIGTVTSANPLQIQIDPQMPPLPAEVLLLADSVVERTEDVIIEPWLKTALEGADIPVTDEVIGTVTVQHGLEEGEKVLMLRVLKGQQYIVLSRVGG